MQSLDSSYSKKHEKLIFSKLIPQKCVVTKHLDNYRQLPFVEVRSHRRNLSWINEEF